MQLLELTIMSAQNLYPLHKDMKTYAVATVCPHRDEELVTQTDDSGGTDPTWNDKFVIRVDNSFLQSETSTIEVEIFAVRKRAFGNNDYKLGTTRILVKTFLNPNERQMVALQIKQPKTLIPRGILNVSICLLGSSSIFDPSKHDSGRRSVALSGITSRPNSKRFESHKIDEDIELAISEQRRLMEYSGPLDMCQEEEQTERMALLSKIERYKSDLSPEHERYKSDLSPEHERYKSVLSPEHVRYKSDLSAEHDITELFIKKKNIKKWEKQSYGNARFWFCGCRTFNEADDLSS